MSGFARREQLVAVGRSLFAEKGFGATSVEEIAARAKVSKPVVYEHFGGKEGLYAVVVDRAMRQLLDQIVGSLSGADTPRELVEHGTMALLTYIEANPSAFRVLLRDSPSWHGTGSAASILTALAESIEAVFVPVFARNNLDTSAAAIYAQMVMGMVGFTGEWWIETGSSRPREELAAHMVNFMWRGLVGLEARPELKTIEGQD